MVKNNEKIADRITLRQAKILAAIIKEFCDTGQPVGSKELVTHYGFDFSAATIRNEMQVLEDMGVIKQPHTSAGRVPTDEGFRFFIQELMEKVRLSRLEQESLHREVVKLKTMHMEMGKHLAKLMARSTHQASFVITPDDVSINGIANLINKPELDTENKKDIAEFFDNIDEVAEDLRKQYTGSEPQALVGSDVKVTKHGDYSMLVSGIQLPDGKQGVVGLLGPKSMKYEKNLSLLDYITGLLGNKKKE